MGLMALKSLPSTAPNGPSSHSKLLLCYWTFLSLWPPWLSGASSGRALACLGSCLRLAPDVPGTGLDLSVPISPARSLLLPDPCLWPRPALLHCSPRGSPLGLRPLCWAVDQVASCGKPVGRGFWGQAVVAWLLIQEEAESVRLGHSELGSTELIQGSDRGPRGHGQCLGGAPTAGVLIGNSDEALCRRRSKNRDSALLVHTRLKGLGPQWKLRGDRDGAA